MQTLGGWRNLHTIVIIGVAAVFLAFSAFSLSLPVPETLTIHSQRYTIEMATTPEQMERGLMFYKSLEPNHGMLFVWPQEVAATMWMKNTLIPLDMLFINSKGVIIYIAHHTTPRSEEIISANAPTKAVLELAGGTSKKHHIQIGDKVDHAIFTGTMD